MQDPGYDFSHLRAPGQIAGVEHASVPHLVVVKIGGRSMILSSGDEIWCALDWVVLTTLLEGKDA